MMKLLMKLSFVFANYVLAFAALGQVQNNSCSTESFLAIRLEQVKIDGRTVIEAWNQVMQQVHVEHPGVAEIAVYFDPVSADPSSTAVPQSRAVHLKLELKDITVRELASMIAELSGLCFQTEVNAVRFSGITAFDGIDTVRHYIYNTYWKKVFHVNPQDGGMEIDRKLKSMGMDGRVLNYDAKSGVISISAESDEHLFLEALLMVARRGMNVEKEILSDTR